jgi:tRNA (guanosine-2'-O-)-methyltransferase
MNLNTFLEALQSKRLVTETRYQRIVRFLTTRQETLRLFLDDVKNAHNISAVIRTCDATGIFYLHYYLTETSLSINRGISLGSERWIRRERVRERGSFLDQMQKKGYQCLATALEGDAIDYREVDYTQPTLIIFGNEKEGISEEVLLQVTRRVTIPMMGMARSLNISVACAVILYEAFRQRDQKGMYDAPSIPPEVFSSHLERWAVEERLTKNKI